MINHKPPKVCWTDTYNTNRTTYKYPSEDLKLVNTHGIKSIRMHVCVCVCSCIQKNIACVLVYAFHYELEERNNM